MTHPAIRAASAARLRTSLGAVDSTPRRSPRSRLGTAVRRVLRPVASRVRDQAAMTVRPDLEAARDDVARLREELARTRAELQAEIELLRAELESLAEPPSSG